MWALDVLVLALVATGFCVAIVRLFVMGRTALFVHLPRRNYGMIADMLCGIAIGVALVLAR